MVADVLNALYKSHEGLRVTHLMRKSNIPYNRIMPIIRELEASGFMVHTDENGKIIYHITYEGVWHMNLLYKSNSGLQEVVNIF